MEFLYCIEHERLEITQNSDIGICHDYVVISEFGFAETDWCFFDLGWATCPEPEYDPDWELNLVEPDEEYLDNAPDLDIDWGHLFDDEGEYQTGLWSFGSHD